jgi:4-cresol dehydrogenase (hydroxylating)
VTNRIKRGVSLAARHLQETIKDAVDPNGILSPGKQGIWPAHLRSRGARTG